MSEAAHWRKRAALLHYIQVLLQCCCSNRKMLHQLIQVVHEGRMRWLNVSSVKWNDLVSLASKSLRKKLELWCLPRTSSRNDKL